jgi:hypothetical protein
MRSRCAMVRFNVKIVKTLSSQSDVSHERSGCLRIVVAPCTATTLDFNP